MEKDGICGRKDELEGKAFNWPHRVFLQQAYEPPYKAEVGALVQNLIFKKITLVPPKNCASILFLNFCSLSLEKNIYELI